MAEKHRSGSEVDSFCNKCKLTLAHTILAVVGDKIARVQCNTCGSQHAFKSPPGAASTAKVPRATTSRASSTRSSSAAPSKSVMSFEALLASKDASKARRYSPKDTYSVDDVIEHPTFGYGVVSGVRADKVDVIFKMDEKTLVHGRGGAPAERPSFARPVPRGGIADKPSSADEADGEEGSPT